MYVCVTVGWLDKRAERKAGEEGRLEDRGVTAGEEGKGRLR